MTMMMLVITITVIINDTLLRRVVRKVHVHTK